MKKILLPLLFTFITSQAEVIDALAIDVEGEAITTLEIQAVMKKMQMSKKATIEALIHDRLEKSAIKKAEIEINPAQVQAKVQSIATQKGLTQAKMKSILLSKGLTWETYIQQVTNEMKKEQFFQEYIASTVTPPSNSELKLYYNTHRDKFPAGTVQMSLVIYSSQSAQKLQEAMRNPTESVEGVQKRNILANSNEMSPKLLELINQTPNNSFSTPVNTGRGFVAYFVKSKGQSQSGFQSVRNQVRGMWIEKHRIQAAQNFFNKLKSNANIRIIRL